MMRRLVLGLAWLTLAGCDLVSGGIKVEPVAVSSQKPGNVALYVAVSQNGSGVVGLEPKDFRVFENGIALDNSQIQLTLLPTAASTSRRAAVLVDMSKALSRDERKSLAEALRPFLVRLRQREAVSLYAFDGAQKVHLIQEYARDARAEPDEKDTSMDRLLSFSRRDASTSLYSAVLDGAEKLSASLASEGRPIENGTMIVIALNPDSAGRVEESKVREFVQRSPHQYFLMTVGPTATKADLSFLAKNGQTRAGSPMTMTAPLNEVASAVDDAFFRNYLVSYCSPARAGKRELKLEVTTRDTQGQLMVGSYATEFDASGFGPGCNSQAAPQFLVAKPKPDETVASSSKANARTASHRASGTSSDAKPPAADARPEASAAPIADPPSGLGYE